MKIDFKLNFGLLEAIVSIIFFTVAIVFIIFKIFQPTYNDITNKETQKLKDKIDEVKEYYRLNSGDKNISKEVDFSTKCFFVKLSQQKDRWYLLVAPVEMANKVADIESSAKKEVQRNIAKKKHIKNIDITTCETIEPTNKKEPPAPIKKNPPKESNTTNIATQCHENSFVRERVYLKAHSLGLITNLDGWTTREILNEFKY